MIFVDLGIWNTDIFTYLTFVIIYLIYESLKTCLLKASVCPPSIGCFRYNIQETMLVTKHYNRLAAGLLCPATGKHQHEELNQDGNFCISISVL